MIGHGGRICGREREGLSPPLSILLSLPWKAVAIFAGDLRRATLPVVWASLPSSLSLSISPIKFLYLYLSIYLSLS